jgi:acetylornithine deacetylase/succinyl-diaminopimelate desuccinylase-like protein
VRPTFVISCHADTGFRTHRLRVEGADVVGHLDNFAGVHAVMKAYFGGGLDLDGVRIELTPDEEIDMSGARRVLRTLSPADVVAVVDVTGAPTKADITIEKCADPALQRFVRAALRGLSFELHAGCPDPVSTADECDVYAKRLKHVFFLGIPCRGGDYNKGTVRARRRSLDTAARALVRLARAVRRGTPQ